MLFVTREFLLGFLPIVLGAFYLASMLDFRKFLVPILLLASIVFYAWGNPAQTPILIVSILVNYAAGRALAHPDMAPARRKVVFVAALLFDLGLLAFFK